MYHTETLCALAHPTPFPQRACHVLPPPPPPPLSDAASDARIPAAQDNRRCALGLTCVLARMYDGMHHREWLSARGWQPEWLPETIEMMICSSASRGCLGICMVLHAPLHRRTNALNS